MSSIKFVLSILFLILIAAFSAVNRDSVPVFYYDLRLAKRSLETPMVFVILVPFLLGFILAWSFTIVNRMKSKAMIKKRNRNIASLNEELDRLRTGANISESVSGPNVD